MCHFRGAEAEAGFGVCGGEGLTTRRFSRGTGGALDFSAAGMASARPGLEGKDGRGRREREAHGPCTPGLGLGCARTALASRVLSRNSKSRTILEQRSSTP